MARQNVVGAELYDVVVVGAGIEGSSAAYHISKQGKGRVLLLEQFKTLHCKGSSCGSSRITRRYYHTDYYTEMMKEAYQLWGDIERESKMQLYIKTGGIIFGKRGCKELSAVMQALSTCGIPYSLLDAPEANEKIPQLNIPMGYVCVIEEDGGILRAERALEAFQRLFQNHGGQLLDTCRVTNIIPGEDVTVVTERETFRTRKLLITAGPWTSLLTRSLDLDLPLKVLRTEVIYWALTDPEERAAEETFPTFRAFPDDSSIHYYGLKAQKFPGLFKICLLDGVEVDPSDLENSASPAETCTVKRVADYVGRCFKGISTTPSVVEQCIYTMTPDEDFILDVHPKHRNIVIGAGMSGHGFKLAPVVGKMLSELVLDLPLSYDLSPFHISRFSKEDM